ncbi:MAG: pyruvate, phosphate dikinase/phosphoenolpyruvate synthase regulator [Desulfobulbaceae bacterium]|uniref:Pyruvate, phosphate dikinase/phosphoenolpyruvate synthase regulator n=1 Tax=Candidatus Desulfatifera sulfidica TaxID=2841691 RepID=A0A8J6N717_9BACT|nr:pyruvate, phosphate dikinase/phosphoenolpyruvate synthase regulator [Candidatus Desulfatifera sulfidica]
MWSSKDVYYLSGSTGILAEDLGKALLCQFPETSFNEEKIPFIRTKEEARAALQYILKRSAARFPLVFSTIMNPKLIEILDSPQVELFNICDHYLIQLEEHIGTKALRASGFSRHLDEQAMTARVSAIKYCIDHDDGTATKDYDEAEIILLGVSRSGKTPVSVYLATQMGIKAANYPLVQDDLNSYRLPPDIVRNKKRVVGLTSKPEMLHHVRQKRYQNSNYASLSNCNQELNQANQIFLKYNIPVIHADGFSIEETATQIAQLFNLKKQISL